MSELINDPMRQNQVFSEFEVSCSRRRASKLLAAAAGAPRPAQHDLNQQGLLL
jgi:hypothetical protein